MRLLKFIGRQMRFLFIGSRSVAVEVQKLNQEMHELSTQFESVTALLEKHERISANLELLQSRIEFLYAHSDNVTQHLHQLDSKASNSSEALSHLSDVVVEQTSSMNSSLTEYQGQLREALRISVDDLSDRIVALTARLNESP